jgi:hypothetical protein
VKQYGIEEFPTVVYFEKEDPHIYNGERGTFIRRFTKPFKNDPILFTFTGCGYCKPYFETG